MKPYETLHYCFIQSIFTHWPTYFTFFCSLIFPGTTWFYLGSFYLLPEQLTLVLLSLKLWWWILCFYCLKIFFFTFEVYFYQVWNYRVEFIIFQHFKYAICYLLYSCFFWEVSSKADSSSFEGSVPCFPLAVLKIFVLF